jgi:hypothetical protein
MENKKVTYGTPTLMEYVAVIKLGKTTLRVPFTGGTITAYGVNPATFTTSNPIYQSAIENSSMFASGRIVKMSETALNGSNKIKLERNPEKEEKSEREEFIEEPAAVTDIPDAPMAAAEEAETQEGEEATSEATESNAATEGEEVTTEAAESEDDANMTLVEVTCLEDAATYLKEQFGVANRQVRSKASAETIGKANGVKFVWV